MTHKLRIYLENLKVLLSTKMELLEVWWHLFKCGEGRGAWWQVYVKDKIVSYRLNTKHFSPTFLVIEEHAHYMNMCAIEIFTHINEKKGWGPYLWLNKIWIQLSIGQKRKNNDVYAIYVILHISNRILDFFWEERPSSQRKLEKFSRQTPFFS